MRRPQCGRLAEPAREAFHNVNGTHGAVTFSALFSKGIHTIQVSFIHGRIIATPHTTSTGNEVAGSALKVIADKGSIIVRGLSVGDNLSLYNLSGVLIYNAKVKAAEVRLDIESGVYLIVSGQKTAKVAVK